MGSALSGFGAVLENLITAVCGTVQEVRLGCGGDCFKSLRVKYRDKKHT